MYCPKLGAQPLNRPALPDVPVSQVGLQRGEAELGQAALAALPDHRACCCGPLTAVAPGAASQ